MNLRVKKKFVIVIRGHTNASTQADGAKEWHRPTNMNWLIAENDVILTHSPYTSSLIFHSVDLVFNAIHLCYLAMFVIQRLSCLCVNEERFCNRTKTFSSFQMRMAHKRTQWVRKERIIYISTQNKCFVVTENNCILPKPNSLRLLSNRFHIGTWNMAHGSNERKKRIICLFWAFT